jgi:DNA-binding PadR family transcriptional regulator
VDWRLSGAPRLSGTEGHGSGTMRSRVNWALLGLVIQRPSYGYELVHRFERTYGETLELSSHSHIYAALDALVKHGLIQRVSGEEFEPGDRQPKPHYRATARGASAYEQWLVCQGQQERRRSRLFAQQLTVLEPELALRVLERYEEAFLKQASALAPDDAPEEALGDDAGRLTALLVSEDDRLAIGARLAWIEYARDVLQALAARRSGTQ